MYEVLVGPSAALVGGFMFPFRAGECDLLWASGVEGAVLLAEAVLEEDLKRLRLRCWLRWGRGMFGQRSRHRLLLRARGCLVFGRLLAAGMIETGPPIVVIGGVQRAAASKQVGDAKWQAVHYISQVRQRRQQRCLAQTDEAGLSGQLWVVEGRLAVQCGCQGWESRELRMRMRYKVCNEQQVLLYGGVSRLMGRHTPKHPRRLAGNRRCGEG